MEAMRQGQPAVARERFLRIVEAGKADASIWLALAHACRDLDDTPGKLEAIERTLALDSRNLRARLLKADHLAAVGDGRAAATFYASVLRLAPPMDQLPPDLRQEMARAQALNQRYAAEYEAFLRERMSERGYEQGRSSSRFAQSLDLMFGRKQIYQQQPRRFYFPELPQIQFYDRAMFPWLDAVEAATNDIRAELFEVLEDQSAFTPYLESNGERPHHDAHGLLDNPDWGAFYLWRNGEAVAANLARCPKTAAALAEAPLDHIPGRAPSVLFSLLRPGTRIPPHHGFVNTRLICHLPLVVPGECGFRVGNEVREWVEGQAWVFDDTIEHEAWNDSDWLRVVLLFDIWRPELSPEERSLVSSMFQTIDAYGQGGGTWDD